MGHDSLVLSVVVADAEVCFRDHLNVYRPAILEPKVQTGKQGGEVIFRVPDDNRVLAAAQFSESVFDQRPSPQVRHDRLTLLRAFRVAA